VSGKSPTPYTGTRLAMAFLRARGRHVIRLGRYRVWLALGQTTVLRLMDMTSDLLQRALQLAKFDSIEQHRIVDCPSYLLPTQMVEYKLSLHLTVLRCARHGTLVVGSSQVAIFVVVRLGWLTWNRGDDDRVVPPSFAPARDESGTP
jgi:hypothetical protein